MLNQTSTRDVVAICSRIPNADRSLSQMVSYVLDKHGATVFEVGAGNWLGIFNLPHQLPVAHYLSLMSAFEIVRTATELGAESVNIGIDCGPVEYEGSLEGQFAISGTVVSNAQRLADEADAGGLLISQQVYDEIRMMSHDFEVLEVTSVESRGDLEKHYLLRPITTSASQPGRSLNALLPSEQAISQVLVAEDDPELRSLFSKVLRKSGFQVENAINGHEVLQFLDQAMPDVLILDLGMPGVSGLEIIRYVRQHEGNKHVNIVVVTGNHLATQRVEVDEADLFLLKPISTRDLVNFVRRFVR
ncbi:MAG: response regulator [Anaerolineae bacterium]|nr:response regulator [Anaerolineae bacterium]